MIPEVPGGNGVARYLFPILIGLIPVTAQAFDPRVVDIIDFRLGMTEAEVTAIIERQGFRDSTFQRRDIPCTASPDRRCVSAIEVRTRDGRLRFEFATTHSEPAVVRISYTFASRKPNEPDALERAVVDRYGPPTVAAPMTWCDQRPGTGPCPAGTPRLTFEPGEGSTRVLTLSLR